jgi:hypothetical protein
MSWSPPFSGAGHFTGILADSVGAQSSTPVGETSHKPVTRPLPSHEGASRSAPLVPISFPAEQGAPIGSRTHDPAPTPGFSRLGERTSGEGGLDLRGFGAPDSRPLPQSPGRNRSGRDRVFGGLSGPF